MIISLNDNDMVNTVETIPNYLLSQISKQENGMIIIGKIKGSCHDMTDHDKYPKRQYINEICPISQEKIKTGEEYYCCSGKIPHYYRKQTYEFWYQHRYGYLQKQNLRFGQTGCPRYLRSESLNPEKCIICKSIMLRDTFINHKVLTIHNLHTYDVHNITDILSWMWRHLSALSNWFNLQV